MRLSYWIARISVLTAAVAVSLTAVAQEPKRDPRVQALLDQSVAAYKAMPSYRAKTTFKYTPDNPDLFRQGQPLSMEIKVQRPNKLNLSYTEKGANGKLARHQIVSDGTNVFRWDSDTNAYTKTKAGNAFPDLPGSLSLPELDALLRAKDPFKELPVPANLLTVGTPVKVGDVDMDVVEGKISGPGLPFAGRLRMLFGQKDHTIRGVTFEGEGKDPRNGKPLSFRVEATSDAISTSPQFTQADFTFTPPAGSHQEEPAVKGAGG